MKKFIYVFLALVLAFSLAGFAAPAPSPMVGEAQAQEEETLEVLPFTLQTGPNAAEWSTEQAATGSYSVKLIYVSGDNSYVEFTPFPGTTFGDLASITTDWSWWYYASAANGPLLELRFTSADNLDPGGAEHIDITVNTAEASPAITTGTTEEVTSASTATCYGNDGNGDAFYDGSWSPGTSTGNLTLAELVTAVTTLFADPAWDGLEDPADWELTRVRAEIWGGSARTCYIDDITVNGTTYYGLIQDAVDSATATIINVAAGTYVEDVTVDVTGITIQGESLSAIVDGGFALMVDDITIDGLTIENGRPGPLAAYHPAAISVEGESDGHSIINNKLIGNGSVPSNGILLCKLNDDILIDGNESYNWRRGITLRSLCSNVTISNNEVYDNLVEGIGLGDSTNCVVTNNDIHGNNTLVDTMGGGGISVYKGSGHAVHYNNIYDNFHSGLSNMITTNLDATLNWWGDASGPLTDENTDGTGNSVICDGGEVASYSPWLGATVGTSPMTFIVDDVGTEPAAGYIQTAINAALEGDTIIVHDGTYNENINIGKSLTIQSVNGWQKTTIQGVSGDVVNITGFAGTLLFTGFEITGGGDGSNGIDVEDLDFTASVTISHCFIWGNSANGIHCGWVDPGATLTIEDNIITQNTGNGLDFGVGMSIVEGTVTIQRNVIGAWAGFRGESWTPFSGNGSNGILVQQLGMTGTMIIDENIIAGNGQYGSGGIKVVKVGAQPDAANPNRGLHITNNIVGAWAFWNETAEEYTTVLGNTGTGIRVEQSLRATFINIEHNLISENENDGIHLGADGTYVEGEVTILENAIGAWTVYPADHLMPGDPITFGGNYRYGIQIRQVEWSGHVLIQGNAIAENGAGGSGGIFIHKKVCGVFEILDNYIGAWTDAHDKSYGGNLGEGIEINKTDCNCGGYQHVVTIARNTISENEGDGIDFNRICDKRTTVTIDDNTITYNEDGIDIHRADRYAVVGIIQNFIAYQEHGIRMGSDADGIDIVCNIITENDHGIYVKGDWNNITRNEISNNVGAADSGIHLESGADNNKIHYNNITGNSAQLDVEVYSYGVYKDGGMPVDATYNWWGDVSGPGGSGPGSGDWINDLVTYDSFLDAPATSCFEGETGFPVIDKAGASPSMISIWTDEMFWQMWDGSNSYSVGPSAIEDPDFALPVWYVVAHDVDSGVASVTINLLDLLIDDTEEPGPQVVDGLIPEEKLQKFIDQLDEEGLAEWQWFKAQFEAWPLKYKAEYDCWHEPRAITDLLRKTIKFFYDELEWEGAERKVVVAEIMGQELNLGEHQVEVTVTDFKDNYTITYIPIILVDFQMPVCEGWNLRSTWLTLENNKWQDILATLDPDGEGSLLRWNNELQRWESYMEDAGVGYWYYGIYQVAPALMKPLEAYWIYSSVNDQFGLITERGITAPPARQMYAGWNLIGADIHWDRDRGKVYYQLLCIEEGEAHCTGYTHVLSVDQFNKWYEDLWVCDSWLKYSEYYEKWFYQETWSYAVTQPGDEFMTRGGGYWVFMANPAVLGGMNSTPLPVPFWHYWWQNCWWD